jgi:hypothetical protein
MLSHLVVEVAEHIIIQVLLVALAAVAATILALLHNSVVHRHKLLEVILVMDSLEEILLIVNHSLFQRRVAAELELLADRLLQ